MTEKIAEILYNKYRPPLWPEWNAFDNEHMKEHYRKDARQILDTLAGGQLTDEEIAEILHFTPNTKLKFESKLTPADEAAFKDEMRLELRAVAHAQAIRSNAQHQKEIGEILDKAQKYIDENNVYQVEFGHYEEPLKIKWTPLQTKRINIREVFGDKSVQ